MTFHGVGMDIFLEPHNDPGRLSVRYRLTVDEPATISANMSTDTRLIYRPSIDRHVSLVSADTYYGTHDPTSLGVQFPTPRQKEQGLSTHPHYPRHPIFQEDRNSLFKPDVYNRHF